MFKRLMRVFAILTIPILAVSVAISPHTARAASHFTVCASGCDYTSIQVAVTAAPSGSTIDVEQGTYVEQVSVTKNLTLTGAGVGKTIIKAPAVLVFDAVGADGRMNVVEMRGPITVKMSGFTVTGPGPSGCNSISTGIAALGGATLRLSDTSVTDIRDTPFSGCQNGEAIRIGTPRYGAVAQVGHATIDEVTASGYQKNGIVIAGTGSSGVITHSVVQGAGPTASIAQNGIEVVDGATADVSGNSSSGHSYTGLGGGATGMLVIAPGSHLRIRGNRFTANNDGIDLGTTSGADLSHNSAKTNDYGVFVESDSMGNRLTHNNLTGNAKTDATDQSAGAGTEGTANTWADNQCKTSSPSGLCSNDTISDNGDPRAPRISLLLTSGRQHSPDMVSGSGFSANETVVVKWNCNSLDCTSRSLGSTKADAKGNFHNLFVAFPAASPGRYSVFAYDTNWNFAAASFVVKP